MDPRAPGLPLLFWIFKPAILPCNSSITLATGTSWSALPLMVVAAPVKTSLVFVL
ncbi:hypothetical protein D3C86_795650 [compost metagenome]